MAFPGLKDRVALRKESVDRNAANRHRPGAYKASLSARRAWIEIISVTEYIPEGSAVALRKESVDRNPQRFGLGSAPR